MATSKAAGALGTKRSNQEPPPVRKLRVYAYDPQASTERLTAAENIAVISLPWAEAGPDEAELSPGPVNGYVEIVDVDPVAKVHYPPVDLNDPHLLGQDGLTPSEGNPQFHQQMVFAVVMKTIKLFERALGRRVLWRNTWDREKNTYTPTQRLRIYPHGLREANAFYSIEKIALIFGYFQADSNDPGSNLPGGWVFTCLSHDIIVHETTHAILDGLQRRFAEATSEDTLAFHEALADTVALLSRFTLPEVVAAQIARHRGKLSGKTLLSQIGRQVGEATGRGSAIRDAFDLMDGQQSPDRDRLRSIKAPHQRGAILVAAIFEAFLSIYETRTADLIRIAGLDRQTNDGALHPDVVNRLASEASKAATHLLRMCIRAIDYMPPVDPRFGDFLRGLITADTDLVPDDRLNYRLSVIEACRRRGIYPEGCRSLAPDSLIWESPAQIDGLSDKDGQQVISAKDLKIDQLDLRPRETAEEANLVAERNRYVIWDWLMQPESEARDSIWERALGVKFSIPFQTHPRWLEMADNGAEAEMGDARSYAIKRGSLPKNMATRFMRAKLNAAKTRLELTEVEAMERAHVQQDSSLSPLASLLQMRSRSKDASNGLLPQVELIPRVEVHSVRITRRVGPDGQSLPQLVIEITQRRRGFLNREVQQTQDMGLEAPREPDFWFRGGARMIIDLRSGKVRYIIRKAIDDEVRLQAQRAFLSGLSGESLALTYGRSLAAALPTGAEHQRVPFEPFALTHRGLI